MEEAFIRQRRNLLVTSTIVFLINFAGIEIGKQITLFGTKFTINNPIVIYISIWIILFYFLIRYIQYYNELDSDDKDYELSYYSWNSYDPVYFNKTISIIWTTIKYIFSNLFGLLPFLWSSIFHKNFTETFFPIAFALFVIITSFYAPHLQNKQNVALGKIKEFTDAISDKTYGQIVIYYNDIINDSKEISNDYYKNITDKDLFEESNKSTKIKVY
jgi:hypothetical protein